MSKAIEFIKASYDELAHKVTWPKHESLQQSTIIILVATIIISLLVWLMDSASGVVFKALYSIFK